MPKVKRGGGTPKTGQSSQGIPSRPAAGQNLTAAKETGLPPRPCLAKNSTPVRLLANYFNLTFVADTLTVYKYTFKVLGSNNKEIRGATAKDIFKSALRGLEAQPHEYATDFQQQIVTLSPLKIPDNDKKRLDVEGFEGCALEFAETVQLQLGASFLSSPSSDVINCLDLITGQWAREQNEVATIGRHRFFPKPKDGDDYIETGIPFPESNSNSETGVPKSLSVIRGFSQSVCPAENKLLLNANTTFSVFRPVGNIGEMCDLLRKKAGGSADKLNAALEKLHDAISKARVSYRLPDDRDDLKKVRIAGFARRHDMGSRSEDPAPSLKIEKDFPRPLEARFLFKNEYRTVLDHFQKKRGLDIRRDLPLINLGKPSRPEYVPAEYCTLLWGQPLKWKATEIPGLTHAKLDQLNELTCRLPTKNQKWIESVHTPQKLNLDRDTNQVLSNFGVSIRKELLEVDGRHLAIPAISYSDKKQAIRPELASWNVAGRCLTKGPRDKKSWTWIYFGGDNQNDIHPDAEQGIKKLDDTLQKMCAQGSPPRLVKVGPRCINQGEGIAAIRAYLARVVQISGIGLVVVVCPDKLPADTYNALKFFADIRIGIHTSCILARKFKKKKDQQQVLDDSYFSNVALKINLKLGGTNHKLENSLELVKKDAALMVVGYDVTHPTEDEESEAEEGGNTGDGGKGLDDGSKQSLPEDKSSDDIMKKRSQVGLVINADEDLGQWLSSYWNQKSRQEMLTETTLTKEFVTLLQAWKSINTVIAKRTFFNVVIYRDGVSESQFDQVLQQEVPNIRQAYKEVFGDKKLRITLVVAIKRHATRFFPSDDKGSDSNGNIRPGTVVDNGVTKPKYWEFFLASHFALQGTAKPTRYVVVLDEIFQKDYRNHPVHNSAAQLERFTHDICYLFGRANKAISVCTPAYYADILCTRARAYMSALANPDTLSEIKKSLPDDADEKRRILAGEIHPVLKKSMYWI